MWHKKDSGFQNPIDDFSWIDLSGTPPLSLVLILGVFIASLIGTAVVLFVILVAVIGWLVEVWSDFLRWLF